MLNHQSKHERYRAGSASNIFGAIYRDGIWGSGQDFMSGAGSHDAEVVDPYIAAVRAFAAAQSEPLTAVDLGCGDFAVGSQLVDAFASYRACDVVPALIERNRAKFVDPRLSFAVVDLIEDALPAGDVAFIRQVLQHLSNDQIARILPKLASYRFIITTEHVPDREFAANHDKRAGPDTRLQFGSGIVLDQPPFNLNRAKRTICRVADLGSVNETILWI